MVKAGIERGADGDDADPGGAGHPRPVCSGLDHADERHRRCGDDIGGPAMGRVARHGEHFGTGRDKPAGHGGERRAG